MLGVFSNHSGSMILKERTALGLRVKQKLRMRGVKIPTFTMHCGYKHSPESPRAEELILPQLITGFCGPPRVCGFAEEMGKSCGHFSKTKFSLYLRHFPLSLCVIPKSYCMSFSLVLSSPSLSQAGRIFPLFLVRQFYSRVQRVSQSCSCIWETSLNTSWKISVSSKS